MSNISTIIIGTLNQEGCSKLISYIEKAGTIRWKGNEEPIYKIWGHGSGNPPFYRDIKITVNLVERKDDKKKVRESLKGLIDILD